MWTLQISLSYLRYLRLSLRRLTCDLLVLMFQSIRCSKRNTASSKPSSSIPRWVFEKMKVLLDDHSVSLPNVHFLFCSSLQNALAWSNLGFFYLINEKLKVRPFCFYLSNRSAGSFNQYWTDYWHRKETPCARMKPKDVILQCVWFPYKPKPWLQGIMEDLQKRHE